MDRHRLCAATSGPQVLAQVAGMLLCITTASCTAVGYGIGSLTPRHERSYDTAGVRHGDRVRVTMRTTNSQPGDIHEGTYEGVRDGTLGLTTQNGSELLPLRGVSTIDLLTPGPVEKEHVVGDYRVAGALVGLALDVAAVVIVIIVINDIAAPSQSAPRF